MARFEKHVRISGPPDEIWQVLVTSQPTPTPVRGFGL